MTDAVEKANDKLEDQKTLMENAADAVVGYIDSLIDGENEAIDALNKANDGIQEQIDKYDSLVNVADRLYEEEQNRLKDEQDLIQEKIDLLNDENDQIDLQYRKQQALYELQRAQQQRTKKVYVEGQGFVYKTDSQAISDAKKNVEDIRTEELISSLEKEKSALQDSIDALQEYRGALSEISDAYQKLVDERNTIELIGEDYEKLILGTNIDDWLVLKDKYIEANDEMADNENLIKSHEEKISIWEDEKKQWQTLSSVIDGETKKQAAIQQFGADWELQINEGRLVAFDEFKAQYLDIEKQINDNTQLIDSYNEKIDYYESLKEQWSSVTSAYDDETKKQYAAMLMGQNWESDILNGRTDKLMEFKDNYISIQKAIADAAWESANEQVKAAKEAAKGANGNVSGGTGNTTSSALEEPLYSVQDANTGTVYLSNATMTKCNNYIASHNLVKVSINGNIIKVRSKNATSSNTGGGAGGSKMQIAIGYASGTDNAKKGWHKVSENGNEIVIDNNDNAYVAEGEQLRYFEGGEKVIKAPESEKILSNMDNLIPVETMTLPGINGEVLRFNADELLQRMRSVMPDYSSMIHSNIQMPKYDYVPVQNNTTPVVQNITMTLPNVTNNSGYERLTKELRQAQLDAYQYVHRR